MKPIALAALILGAASFTSNALAFDGERSGFQLSLGAGANKAVITATDPQQSIEYDSNDVAIGFSLGYGLNNHLAVYGGIVGGGTTVRGIDATATLVGFGLTYSLSTDAGSLYLTGMVGSGSLRAREESSDTAPTGPGWSVGLGYHVTPHVLLEVGHMQAELEDPNNASFTYDVSQSSVRLGYLWF
jgi:long-subunit fatty acid transport protein